MGRNKNLIHHREVCNFHCSFISTQSDSSRSTVRQNCILAQSWDGLQDNRQAAWEGKTVGAIIGNPQHLQLGASCRISPCEKISDHKNGEAQNYIWGPGQWPGDLGLKQEKIENIIEVKGEKCPLRWRSPKRRSMCFKKFSETPHAVLTITSCNNSVAYQINKCRSFSSSVSSFLWQIQNVSLKPVFQNVVFFKKKKKKPTGMRNSKTQIDCTLLVMVEQMY